LKPSESARTSPTRGIIPATEPEISARPPAPTLRMALLSATNETISFTLPNQSVIVFGKEGKEKRKEKRVKKKKKKGNSEYCSRFPKQQL
jgi:hypothetical protein